MNQNRRLIPFKSVSESFEAFKDNGMYYVDKTGFIPYLIHSGDAICVVTRPRRFGKTLMLRMLQTFFEYVLDEEGKPVDNRHYFEGLKVMEAGEDVLRHLGQYPVISLTLKDVSGDSYEEIIGQLREAVCQATKIHRPMFRQYDQFGETERTILQSYQEGSASEEHLRNFLSKYTQWLNDVTKHKVVILLDEYDVPLQQAAIYDSHHPGSDLFEKTVKLIGKFISSGFKSNTHLAYGIISGCMRVAKESIFSGMNNPGVIDVTTKIPDEFLGFTEAEVKQMLAYYHIDDQYSEIERWYDGYNFGGRKVFNPWSLLNAIRALVNGDCETAIQPYWVLTSGNDIIEYMIERNPNHREGLAKLMNGETQNIIIYKNISYRDLERNAESIWSLMIYTGYLKIIRIWKNADDVLEATVAIPNKEIRSVMVTAMRHWWEDQYLESCPVDTLGEVFWNEDIDGIEEKLNDILMDSVSVFDYHENFYHGMLLGLLMRTPFHRVESNREYGEGRPDIVAYGNLRALVFELKCVTQKQIDACMKSNPQADEEDIIESKMIAELECAEQQIDRRRYVKGVKLAFPNAKEIKIYVLCFCRKRCMARLVEMTSHPGFTP